MADELGSIDEIGLVDDNYDKIDPIGVGLVSATQGPIGLEAGNSSNNAFGSGPLGLEAYDMEGFKFGSATTDEQGKEIESRLRLGGADCDLGINAALNPQVAVRTEQMKGIEGEDSTGEKDVETVPSSRISSEGKCSGGNTGGSFAQNLTKEGRQTVEETLEETMKGSCARNLTKEGRQPQDTKKGSSASLLHRLAYLQSLLTSSKREEKRLRSVICRSLLLPVVSAIVLWFSRGDPLLVVWRLSLMLCYGCLFWTNFLIETLGRGTVFMYITYGLLLASWADSMLNPAMGVLIVHLNSHFATGLLGYALAERLQRQGIERSAFGVHIPTSDEEVKRLHVLRFFGGLALACPMLGVVGGMLWLVWHSADYAADELVMDTLILLPAALLFGIVIVAVFQLQGALISADHIVFVMLYFIFVTLLRAFCIEALDNVVGMIITWVAVLALSGLLGYCVSVLASLQVRNNLVASFCFIKDTKLSQTVEEEQLDRCSSLTLGGCSDSNSFD